MLPLPLAAEVDALEERGGWGPLPLDTWLDELLPPQPSPASGEGVRELRLQHGYAAESWYGLFAPAKTPPEIIDRLNKAAATAVKAEAFKKLSVDEGLVMVASPADELDRYFREQEDRRRQVIRDAGIKAE